MPARPKSTALGVTAQELGFGNDSLADGLSIAAILISVVALIFNFLKMQQVDEQQAALPQEPAPLPALPPPPRFVQEEAAKPTTMDEVAMSVKEDLVRSKELNPKAVVLELQRGNARFWSGTPERPEMNVMERRALIIGQAPSVCILSCADSRVPVEIVFDQGLGRVFVVRVAGNILDPAATGSIEFAIKYLGVKVLLVMGHEGCGAVKGAMAMSQEEIDSQPQYLRDVLQSIRGNLNIPRIDRIRDSRAKDREAIIVNVTSQVKKLQQNALVSEKVANGKLIVCGAFYEITSGIVDFFTLGKDGLITDL